MAGGIGGIQPRRHAVLRRLSRSGRVLGYHAHGRGRGTPHLLMILMPPMMPPVMPAPRAVAHVGETGFGGRFPLGAVALEVAEEAETEGVLDVHALHGDHVAGHLGHALPEAHGPVVHGQGGGVQVVAIQSCNTETEIVSIFRPGYQSTLAVINRTLTQ
jgi:hypothetical protein